MIQYIDCILQDKFIVLDLETSSLNPRTGRVLSVAWKSHNKRGCLFAADGGGWVDWQDALQERLPELRDPHVAKLYHNMSFDLPYLINKGIRFKGPHLCSVVLAQLVNENRSLALDDLVLQHFGEERLKHFRAIDQWRKGLSKKSGDYLDAPRELLREYNLEDVDNTYDIAKLEATELVKKDATLKKTLSVALGPKDYFNAEAMPFERAAVIMSRRGIKLNLEAMATKRAELEKEIAQVRGELNALLAQETAVVVADLWQKEKDKRKTEKGKEGVACPAFNWNSGPQVGRLFYEVCRLKEHYIGRSKTGQWSCSEDHLKMALTRNLPEKLKKACTLYSQSQALNKKIGTDIDGLLRDSEDGRIFPTFRQASGGGPGAKGTATGRLSSSRNVQNIPPWARSFYIPDSDKHVFIYADYSQLELRIAAHLSQDRKMLAAYRNNEDLHDKTAKALFGTTEDKEHRKIAKTSNFLKIYNGSPSRHKDQLFADAGMVISFERAKEIHEKFFEYYSDYKDFLFRFKKFLVKNRVALSPFGRIRRLPDLQYAAGLNYQGKSYAGIGEETLRREFQALPEKNKWSFRDGQKTKKTLFDFVSGKVRHALNQGYNFPGQSVGASICKRAILALQAHGYDIVNNIHDSVYIQVEKEGAEEWIPKIKEIMENVVALRVPLVVEPKLLTSFFEEDVWEG